MSAPEDDDLYRIEQGGIPLAAEQRLAAGRGAFSSDLSVAGFALCDRLGLKPIAQVMGSSVYQVGFQPSTYPTWMGGAMVTELEVLSDAWNEVRRRALNRLELEARHAGAQAVVGVDVKATENDLGALEYAVMGTAVRREGAAPAEAPVLTELSVADYAKLLDAGYEPVGIVARTSVFFAAYGANWVLQPQTLAVTENFELREFTEGVYGAREQTMGHLGQQAAQLGASGIVGVRLRHTVRRQEVGSGSSREQSGAMIVFDAIGTAIRQGEPTPSARPEATLDLSF